ncbi:unnamed protein product [Ectocarpus sp. 12 AP-2014]
MLADSIVALSTHAQTSPAGISLTTSGHHHHHHHHHQKHGGCARDREEGARVKATGGMGVDEGGAAATLSSKVKTEVGEEEGPPVSGGRGTGVAGARAVKTESSSAVLKGAVAGGRERTESPSGGVAGRAGDEASGSASVHTAEPTPAEPRPGDGTAGEDREGSDWSSMLAAALLLIRHAMQDTFGKGAVNVASRHKKKPAPAPVAAAKQASHDRPPSAEIKIDTDGAVARLRVYVVPPESTDVSGSGESGGRGSAGWRCEVVECTRDSLGSQISMLVERLRAAVSRS